MSAVALGFGGALLAVTPEEASRPPIEAPLVVDPNTAPAPVLLALPKLGPALVGRIVAARESEPFRSLDDVDARVRGIGPATAEALRPFFRFGPDRSDEAPAVPAGDPPAARNAPE